VPWRRILGEVAVPVEVVGRDVQDRGHLELQRMRRLELIGRELEHVHRRGRSLEQVERGLAEVAAHAHGESRRFCELADERRHGALAVRARDADQAPARFARKELDVAHEVEAVGRGLAQEWFGERDAGRYDHLVGAFEHCRVETAERGRGTGHEALEFREPRRVRA
jgi:hypothetical protein